eukprot:g531.t1
MGVRTTERGTGRVRFRRRSSTLGRISTVLLGVLLVFCSKGTRILPPNKSKRNEKEDTLSLLETDAAMTKSTQEVRAKLIFVAIAAASVVCAIGFSFWKHKYLEYGKKIDAESLELYERHLFEYTNEAKSLIDRMKEIMTKAQQLSEKDVVTLNEELTQKAKRFKLKLDERNVEAAHHQDQSFLFSSTGEAKTKSQEIMYASKMYTTVEKTLEAVAILDVASGVVGEAASATVFGGVTLIASVVRNVWAIRKLSTELKSARAKHYFSASMAESEGQKVLHHAKWAVCTVVGELHADIEKSVGYGNDDGLSELEQTARRFLSEMEAFWKEKKCSTMTAHEFVVDDVVRFKRSNDGPTLTGTVLGISPRGEYEVRTKDDDESIVVRQREIFDVDSTAGRVPPIRGNGVVTDVAVSSEMFTVPTNTRDPAYGFEFVCSSEEEGEDVCELNEKYRKKSDREKRTCADNTKYKGTNSGETFMYTKDTSRVLLMKCQDTFDHDDVSSRALYKVDLHTLFVTQKGDWSSAAASLALALPGWVTKEKYPIMHHMIPDSVRHMWRYAKRSVMPNPNLDAVALMRGIDYELCHYLRPCWDLTDVQFERNRWRCGKRSSKSVGVHTRWSSVCAEDDIHGSRHSNQFRARMEQALARGRNAQEKSSSSETSSSETSYVPILDAHATELNKQIVIFWNTDEDPPEPLSRLTTARGPCWAICTIVGVPNAMIEGYDVKIETMNDACDTKNTYETEEVIVRMDISDTKRFAEAARVLSREPCEDAMDMKIGALPCGQTRSSTLRNMKRTLSRGKIGKKQFTMRIEDKKCIAKIVGNEDGHVRFRVHFDNDDGEEGTDAAERLMTPAQAVVATIMGNDNAAHGVGVQTSANPSAAAAEQSNCDTLSATNMLRYESCVAMFMNEPNLGVDDRPGWHSESNYKLVAKHEVLPDLRFMGSSRVGAMFAFQARKSDATLDEPPIRDLRLTFSASGSPELEGCAVHETDEENYRTPIVKTEQRETCNWWRITTSLGDGMPHKESYDAYLWVKRRFAIDPCKLSSALGGTLEWHRRTPDDGGSAMYGPKSVEWGAYCDRSKARYGKKSQ